MTVPFRKVAVVGCAAAAAGCGGSSGNGPANPPVRDGTPPPVTTPSPTPPAGPGTFVNMTDASGISFTVGFLHPLSNPELEVILPSGAAAGDYDDDGDIDLFIVRGDGGPNLLYRNTGNLVFEEVAAEAGVALTKSAIENYRHSSPAFADLDGDNDLDLLLSGLDGDPTLVFASNGDGTFTESAEQLGLDDAEQGRGIVCADFDNDGDTDILQLHMHAENAATLWMNEATNNWLSVRLRGEAPNTQAIGARIVANIAGEDHLREVTLGSNFASHNPTDQLFGLGAMTQVETLTVEWPDGERTVMQALAANRELVIDHPQR